MALCPATVPLGHVSQQLCPSVFGSQTGHNAVNTGIMRHRDTFGTLLVLPRLHPNRMHPHALGSSQNPSQRLHFNLR